MPVAEIRSGRKRSHWMWFVFPQLQGLGYSAMAKRYGITGLAEARAYLAHPVLGARLHECAEVLDGLDSGGSAADIFGSTDTQKVAVQPDAVRASGRAGFDLRAPSLQVLRRRA